MIQKIIHLGYALKIVATNLIYDFRVFLSG